MKSVCYYRCHTGDNAFVEYLISNEACVFTGITPRSRSTINAEEDIILAICKEEGITPNQIRWFDLQTNKGYVSSHAPGAIEFDELVFNYNGISITDMSWEATPCPKEIRELFAEHIAGR